MVTILSQQNRNMEIRLLKYSSIQTIIRRFGQPAQLSNSVQTWTAVCLGCVDRPCMTYVAEELQFDAVQDFPASPETVVCPVNAISWNEQENQPQILLESCIGCGLCAARCPVSAIYFADGFRVSEETDGFLQLPDTSENRNRQWKQLAELRTAEIKGTWFADCTAQVQQVYAALKNRKYDPQFPNRTVRNCLLGLGCRCVIRRRGDVNLRMDALFSCGDQFGVAEIEFHQDALEPPRAVLDDIAVLHARYGIDKQTILPLIVHLELPNARTGHWQVIRDIASVLNIRIRTVTLGALLLLLWYGKPLSLYSDTAFLWQERRSLREFLAENGIETTLPIGCCSILEPEK